MKKDQQEPLVTIIVPSSGAEKYISRAVESLVAQTYSNLEVIILDEGLSGRALKTLKTLQKEASFKILRFAKNSDPFYGLNFALQKAKGKFLGIMELEDISFVDRIEKQVRFLLENPKTVAVGGQSFLINAEGEVVGEEHFPCKPEDVYRLLFVCNPIALSGALINRTLLPADFVFFSGPSKIAADLELVFKLAQFGDLVNLKEKVIFRRLKGGALSWKTLKKTFSLVRLVRTRAIRHYDYQPSFLGWLGHFAESVGVKIFPARLSYFIYRFVKVKRVVDRNQPGLVLGMRNAFNKAFLPEKFPGKALLFFLLLGMFSLSRQALAEENCGTQYGKDVCPIRKITIDKKVWNPWDEKFVDNLADITPTGAKFVVGDHVYFRIIVKNEGSETIENIRVEDTLPAALKFVAGDLSFDISRLAPGQLEEKQIEAEAVSAPSDCRAENVAVARANGLDVRDTSWVCIVQERAAEIEVLPVTGFSLWFYALAALITGSLGLIIISLNKGETNVQ